MSSEDEKFSYIASVDEGIMGGNGNGEFRPNDNLSEAQMATIRVRALSLEVPRLYHLRMSRHFLGT